MSRGSRVTSAVVIGGGVGGLATAALLARGGLDVTLVERQESLGGRIKRTTVGALRFDTGPSWYLLPEAYTHFFGLLDRSIEDYLELVDLPVRHRVFFEGRDGQPADTLDVVADQHENWEAFDRLSRGDGDAASAYALGASETYQLALRHLLYSTYENPLAPIGKEVLRASPRLARLLAGTLEKLIAKRIAHPRLRQLLAFRATFLGASAARTSAVYSLLSHADLVAPARYPMGGFFTVIEALEKIALEEGVTIRTNADVARILVDPSTRRATAVALRSGEILPADIVVSAADMHHTETELLAEDFQDRPEPTWAKRTVGPSALIIMASVSKSLPELSHHNLFFPRDDERPRGRGADLPPSTPASLYATKATETDPRAAPKGKETLVVVVPVPANPALGATDASKEELERIAWEYLDQVGTWAQIPDFHKRTTIHGLLTPFDFATEVGSWQGSAMGLENTPRQSGPMRPGNLSRRVRNLLYAGSSTTPGIGIPMCLISAELVVKRLLGDRSDQPLSAPLAPNSLATTQRGGLLGAILRGNDD